MGVNPYSVRGGPSTLLNPLIKGCPQNRGLFDCKFFMLELGDFGDSNASGSEIYIIYNTVTET